MGEGADIWDVWDIWDDETAEGFALKAKQRPIENKPDTRGVVNTMGSHNAAMGRMKGPEDRRRNPANNMVSGNASRKK